MSADDLTLLFRGLDQTADLLAAVPQADASAPTPCEAWTVTELVRHVAAGPAKFAELLRGEQPDWSTQPAFADAVGAFAAGTEELRAAWDAADPAGAPPVGMQLAEVAVHTYDLATSLGRPTTDLDPAVAERGLEFMRANLTAERRGGAFGPEQTPPTGADAYARIAAFAGRTV